MRTLTQISAKITALYKGDLLGARRVVRSLVSHPDLPEDVLLLPVRDEGPLLSGIELPRDSIDPAQWLDVVPPTPWQQGRVPVGWSEDGDPPVILWTHEALEEHRRRLLADEVMHGFGQSPAPLLERVSRLEHIDGVLGGHVISTAALLALAENNPGSAILGEVSHLRDRFHAAAPAGLGALRSELMRPAFRELQSARVADHLLGAATRADMPNGALRPDAWQACGERTLWSWWLHWKSSTESQAVPMRSLATKLQIPPDVCVKIARQEETPQSAGVEDKLPSRERAISQLKLQFDSRRQPRWRLRHIHRAQAGRLGLFVRQLAELERSLGGTRLGAWQETRGVFADILGYLRVRTFAYPWKNAMEAAQILQRSLGDTASPQAEVTTSLQRLGIQLAGAALGSAARQGSCHGEPGSAPVIFLTPAALEMSAGAVRFAALHQLGHLLHGDASPCAKWVESEDHERINGGMDEAEAFANAFAAYSLAPRESVRSLVPGLQRWDDAGWLQSAGRDVALSFGLGPAAALSHLQNCFGAPQRRLHHLIRSDDAWRRWAEELDALITDRWGGEKQRIKRACGSIEAAGVEEALDRPRSPVFDDLLYRSVQGGHLQPELIERYQ